MRDSFAEDDEEAREQLDEAFAAFETSQPQLAAHAAAALAEPLDETALALGYFLVLAVWLGFRQAHGEFMELVTDESLQATEASVTLDEQLRLADPAEALDTDDVVAMEQPHLLEFINDHVNATLESHAEHIDVDDVHAVYRLVLIVVLALSYAVKPPEGYPMRRVEASA